MGTAAEIDEVRSQGVFGEDVVGALFDEFDLHRLIHLAVLLEAGFLLGEAAFVLQVLRLEFPHFLLDAFEVFGAEWLAAIEIVVKAVLHGRTDAEFGVRKQFEDCSGQQVRGGVPVDVESVGIFGRQDLHRRVFFEGTREIVQVAIDLSYQRGVGQTRADFLRDVNGFRCPPERSGRYRPAELRECHS